MFEPKYLIVALIGMDVALIAICALLIRKIRSMPKSDIFQQGINIFESLIEDADAVGRKLQEEVRHKHHLINRFGSQMDRRIDKLRVMLNRAEIVLSPTDGSVSKINDSNGSVRLRQKKIVALAESGCHTDEIAYRLSIPKGEVKLVLDLNKSLKRS